MWPINNRHPNSSNGSKRGLVLLKVHFRIVAERVGHEKMEYMEYRLLLQRPKG